MMASLDLSSSHVWAVIRILFICSKGRSGASCLIASVYVVAGGRVPAESQVLAGDDVLSVPVGLPLLA